LSKGRGRLVSLFRVDSLTPDLYDFISLIMILSVLKEKIRNLETYGKRYMSRPESKRKRDIQFHIHVYGIIHILSNLIILIILSNGYHCYLHFTREKTKAKKN
jgi:hypothetical protein